MKCPPRWKGARLIAVDDLHVLVGKEVTQRAVARRLLDICGAGTQVLCAGGSTAAELPEFVAVLRASPMSRVIEMGRPSAPVLRRIVSRAAREQRVSISGRAMTAMIRRAEGDIGRALGLVARARFEAVRS